MYSASDGGRYGSGFQPFDRRVRRLLARFDAFHARRQQQSVVVVHALPVGKAVYPATPEATYIDLVVDGDIVDLNRIPLPPDTPIIDERFKGEKDK